MQAGKNISFAAMEAAVFVQVRRSIGQGGIVTPNFKIYANINSSFLMILVEQQSVYDINGLLPWIDWKRKLI